MKTFLELILIHQLISRSVLACTRSVNVSDDIGMVLGMALIIFYLYLRNCLDSVRRLFVLPPTTLFGRALLMGFSFIILFSLLMEMLPTLPDWYESSVKEKLSSPGSIIVLVLLAPLFEELFFRKAITDALLQECSPWGAILASGILFGLFHLNPAQVVPAIFIGILLTWIYYTTQSLLPTLLIHIINNGLAVLIMIYVPESDKIWQTFGWPIYGIVLTIFFFLFIVSLRWFRKSINVSP